MRKTTFLLCLLMPLFLAAQQGEVISLNDGWQFTQTNNSEAGGDPQPSTSGWYDTEKVIAEKKVRTILRTMDIELKKNLYRMKI